MRKILIVMITVLLTSCTTHHIYFDIEKQQLISCNNTPLSKISVYGNSVNGKDDSCTIKWGGFNDDIPFTLDLNNIPNEYIELDGGIRLKPFKLYPNSEYTIIKDGMGINPHYIKIWTNAKGIVYKTTSPNCDSGDGGDGIPEDWVR